ncbi:hypothetical protein C8J57DRAFT_1255140 [Mycena rebaudengoi]|nr:hypothetical protein C8J57DRAFT_1255140 [Mycena rebaudengoi]
MPGGRPKGSKDGPRLPGAPRRGRPPTAAIVPADSEGSLTDGEMEELDQLEQEAFTGDRSLQDAAPAQQSPPPPPRTPPSGSPNLEQLRSAARCSQFYPFFSKREVLSYDADSEDDGTISDDDEERESQAAINMPAEFSKEKAPLIPKEEWEPCPACHFQRHEAACRIILDTWLPHFHVKHLNCPHCGAALEKNGAVAPRQVTDWEDNFYIVTWRYYCRDGCKKTYRGWSPRLLDSLPAYLRLAFPATLSRKSGLSHRVITMLRGGNQHKMGPSGVHSLLYEMHTLRFNTLQLQYLERMFEQEFGISQHETGTTVQSTLHNYSIARHLPAFGDFGDPHRYAGFVPTVSYLTCMMKKAIERDEADADQHTACLPINDLAIDDSHKVNKHIAKQDDVPVFGALWTCMASFFIRSQALTLTKSHEERLGPLMGIAASAKRYGHGDPAVDKALLYAAFPLLAERLTPMAAAHGLKSLDLLPMAEITVLESAELAETIFASLMAPLDDNPNTHLCVHFFRKLPAALVHLLISKQVFLVGCSVKGDLTRLKKQFAQLNGQSFNVIDLKQFAIQRGAIEKKESGSLDVLADKLLGAYLSRDN